MKTGMFLKFEKDYMSNRELVLISSINEDKEKNPHA